MLLYMGGDFRQILPVIPHGSRSHIVNFCINSSYLWNSRTVFTLKQNMRLMSTGDINEQAKLSSFSKWLLDVGDGNIASFIDGINKIALMPVLLMVLARLLSYLSFCCQIPLT